MSNLELDLNNIQNQIDSLSKALTEAQNQKIATEVHLQNEQQELDAVMQQLRDLTGLNDMEDIKNYIADKQIELESIIQDLQNVSGCVNSQYTFTDNDVRMLKDIIDKYNIPIVQ